MFRAENSAAFFHAQYQVKIAFFSGLVNKLSPPTEALMVINDAGEIVH